MLYGFVKFQNFWASGLGYMVFLSLAATVTTGFRFFADCLRHSAKAILHSAKPLPSAVLGKAHTVKN